jgi:hypothetical protein
VYGAGPGMMEGGPLGMMGINQVPMMNFNFNGQMKRGVHEEYLR